MNVDCIIGRVSIIVPVYNCQLFIGECIDSICRQNYTNLEILCVNDGSTDQSELIIKDKQRADDRVVLINQNNRGVSSARNVGIQHATGEWIFFVDADDIIYENAIELLVLCAQKQHADIIIPKYATDLLALGNGNGNSTKIDSKLLKKTLLNYKKYIDRIPDQYKFPSEWSLAYSWGRLIHRSLLNKNVCFNERLLLGEDVLFNYDILSISHSTILLDKCIYYYRPNENSVTSSFQERRLENTIVLAEEIGERTQVDNVKDIGYQFVLGRVIHCYMAYFGYLERKRKKQEITQLLSIPYINSAVRKGKVKYCNFEKKVLFKSIGIKLMAIMLRREKGRNKS